MGSRAWYSSLVVGKTLSMRVSIDLSPFSSFLAAQLSSPTQCNRPCMPEVRPHCQLLHSMHYTNSARLSILTVSNPIVCVVVVALHVVVCGGSSACVGEY